MNLISLQFAAFTIIVLILYYMLPRRPQNYLLLTTSYIFYATLSMHFLWVLAGITIFNFILARELPPRKRKDRFWLLWIGIAGNLLVWGFFKYTGFFIPEITELLTRIGFETDSLKILLPVGLSFYILQAVSYLVDVYRGQLPAAVDSIDFALYFAYFPKLMSGPIERARVFLPLLARRRVVDNEVLSRGAALILIGLVRKTVIADPLLRAIPAGVFETPSNFSALALAAWLLAFGFGIYMDFAGYTDLMRGISRLFGIELSPNFAQPLFSRNFAELWTRWHITLSQWLRDYIYFPLSRALVRKNPSRGNLVNLVLPPMATMIISGVWHGTGWNMLVWGGLMGLYQTIERIPGLLGPVIPMDKRPAWRGVLTTGLVLITGFIALVPFRMELAKAMLFWKGLLDWKNLTPPESWIFLLILPGLWIDWMQHRGRDELVFLKWPFLLRSFLMALAMLLIFLSTRRELGAPFVYQGF